MTGKQHALEAIDSLPDNAGVEDAIEKLYLVYKIERGVEQADAGQKVTQEEARERMGRWLK